jgi:hypothetical protein
MRDLRAVKNALTQHQIELPSWAFGNSGTRFKVFGQPGVPRTPYEKADDAAQVHKYTGVASSMAVHIPVSAWPRAKTLEKLPSSPPSGTSAPPDLADARPHSRVVIMSLRRRRGARPCGDGLGGTGAS